MTPHQGERKQEPRPSHTSSEQLEGTAFAPTPTFPFAISIFFFILFQRASIPSDFAPSALNQFSEIMSQCVHDDAVFLATRESAPLHLAVEFSNQLISRLERYQRLPNDQRRIDCQDP